jgi:hypothetical protein
VPVSVIPKLTQPQPFQPLFRVSRNETPQITLDGLVNTLGLPVRLGMIGSAHAQLRARGMEDALPELAGEH